MKGQVIKSTGSWYIVLDETGRQWECRLRGKIRLDGLRSTNPVAVGDKVDFEQVHKALEDAADSLVNGREGFLKRMREYERRGED